MAAAQAERLWKTLSKPVEEKNAADAKSVTEGLASLKALVERKAEPEEVAALVRSLTKTLEAHISGGMNPNIRATVAAVRAADADIKGERVVDDYRLGVVAFTPRAMGRYEGGVWTPVPVPAGTTHLLGVVVRERGTKRPLASTKVTADWGAGAVVLEPVWGDYSFYGANAVLPEGTFTLKVDVEPPKICRHGDALAGFMTNGHAEFRVTRRVNEVTVEAPKPGPVIGDYRIGGDVEQALAEPLFFREEGGFKVGFIAEGPEPIWVWVNGVLEPRPANPDDTHHLEIVLLDHVSNRIVMGAVVSLELKNKATGEAVTVEMHNLLSTFAHYGRTVKVLPADYRVTASVVPPRDLMFEEGRFRAPLTVEFDWNGKTREK